MSYISESEMATLLINNDIKLCRVKLTYLNIWNPALIIGVSWWRSMLFLPAVDTIMFTGKDKISRNYYYFKDITFKRCV